MKAINHTHTKKVSERSIIKKYELLNIQPAAPSAFNCYVCSACGYITKTIDIHEGVTPMFLTCRSCQNTEAKSTFYKDLKPDEPPVFEWFVPTLKELLKLKKHPDFLDHILRGGLQIRKIENEVR